jgi:pimeloyl-ACP methyl ester carboxylesterase
MKKILFLGAVLSLALVIGARAAESPTAGERKFTYVFIHGGWTGGFAFKEVERLLRADGHTVYRPTLTGLGERVHLASADINLTTHVTDIVNVILWENLHDVVLVGHSYGGMVMTGVVDRVPDRIRHVIYVDAGVLNNGESITDIFPEMGRVPVVDGFMMIKSPAEPGPGPQNLRHPAKTISEKMTFTNQEAVKKIPTTFVLCVPPGSTAEKSTFYRFYLRAKERGWKTLTMESDHNVHLSHPKEFAALLEAEP